MPAERKAKLEALPWWSWSLRAEREAAWEAQFSKMVAYCAAHGRVPPHRAGGSAGKWANKQRAKRATMSAERKAKLEALPWWSWNPGAAGGAAPR